jgi:hypothetical protein
MSEKSFPMFPFEFDEVAELAERQLSFGTVKADEDVRDLIYEMFEDPDSVYFYYFPKGEPIEAPLKRASDRGDILIRHFKYRYFRHPDPPESYIHVPKHPAPEGFFAQVAAKGPEYIRASVRLSQRMRLRLDSWQKVQLEEQYRAQLRQEKYTFDVFLSFSSRDQKQANAIHQAATSAGLHLFMAPKELKPGDDFAEEIRNALVGAAQLWMLVSPESLESEWVTSEWGAAWALDKRIVPILFRCSPEDLPDRLRRLQCVDFHEYPMLIEAQQRASKASAETSAAQPSAAGDAPQAARP